MSLRLALRGQRNVERFLTRWIENRTKRGFPSSPSTVSISLPALFLSHQFFFYFSFFLEYYFLSISLIHWKERIHFN